MVHVEYGEIEEFVNEVVKRFEPQRVILFGSYADGSISSGSDVDLMVIMDFEGRPQLQAFRIRRDIKRTFPLDLIVRKPSEIDRRLAEGDFFLEAVLKNGKVLYERPGHRMA
jgi:predicted nucleotidyltransferase